MLENAAFAGKEASSSGGRSPEDKKLPHNDSPLLIQGKHSKTSLVLELRGNVTAEAEADLLTYRDERTRLRGGSTTLIINFQKVGYVDSGGLSVLVRLARAVTDDGSRVFAHGLHPSCGALFRLVGITRYIMIYPDEYAIEQRVSSSDNPHAVPKAARITF
ncbi:hypothetical protein SK3146_04095 [Paenibacillus konkukensis]|uniref:STAS domain-containing protein n=1 Tax=Paenibacillus konkukensis TaxID=2020716 RepID=A0ABY4RRM9_9BACL|nr:STAS domain-containing protein [Paenibacillus konkukensis]UQZ84840.1 hypothetical protein SK3146_04095 [Paenibacillus konkukensis]